MPENAAGESFIHTTEYLLQIDLKKVLKEKFWAHPDLNQGPTDYESAALTD